MQILAIFAFSVALIVLISSLVDHYRSRRRAAEFLQSLEKLPTRLQKISPETEMETGIPAAPSAIRSVSLDAAVRRAITEHLPAAPRHFEIETLIDLKHRMGLIAKELEGMHVVADIAKSLEFVTIDEFRVLVSNPTLRLSPYLDGYFANQIEAIRASARLGNQEEFKTALDQTHTTVTRLEQFVSSWTFLREVASSGIGPLPTEEFIQLKHACDNLLVDPTEQKLLNWHAQLVMGQPLVLLQLSAMLRTLIEDVGWRFDYICSLSDSGLPLAIMLGSHFKKMLLEMDNITFSFAPYGPDKNTRVLVVDSILQTGGHLLRAKERIEKEYNAKFAGCIVLVDNDMRPPERKRVDQVDSLMKDGQIVFLYEMSDLYAFRKKTVSRETGKTG
jgi:orotate phosphoribosyltransferase